MASGSFWSVFCKRASFNLAALRSIVTSKLHPAIKNVNQAMTSAYSPMQAALQGGMRRTDMIKPHIDRFQAAQPQASAALDRLWGILHDLNSQGIMADAAPLYNKYFGIASNLQNKLQTTDQQLRTQLTRFLQKPAAPDPKVWTASAAINAANRTR